MSRELLLIALDDVGGTHSAESGIEPCLATGAALAQQVPALIQTDLEVAQPPFVVLAERSAGRGLGLEVVLLFDQLVDLGDEVFIHGAMVGTWLPRSSGAGRHHLARSDEQQGE